MGHVQRKGELPFKIGYSPLPSRERLSRGWRMHWFVCMRPLADPPG